MRTVSIIVPAYNQARYLAGAIGSALAQTCDDLEVLVVDDGSTDDTRAVTAAFADPRVRYFHQENRGLSAARNSGLRQARGAFVTFLDSDDQFLPGKLATLLAAFDADPALGFAAGQAVLIDEEGQPIGETFDRGLPADLSALLLGNPLHVGSVLVRRDWLERIEPFDETLRSYEDWDCWLRLARAGCPMAWVAQAVSLYRFHRAQMTRISRQMTEATFAVLEKTFNDPQLPAAWVARRDQAYARAHLRAAAQAYTAGDAPQGCSHMRDAVRLEPALGADDGQALAGVVAGWANHAKTPEPLAFLERIYGHLPDELAGLRRRGHEEVARVALDRAFAAHAKGDGNATRRNLLAAVRRRPALAGRRGTLSLFVKSMFVRSLPADDDQKRQSSTALAGEQVGL